MKDVNVHPEPSTSAIWDRKGHDMSLILKKALQVEYLVVYLLQYIKTTQISTVYSYALLNRNPE